MELLHGSEVGTGLCGITTWSVMSTSSAAYWGQCANLIATCYCFRPLNKVVWYYYMFIGGHTSELVTSVLTWQPHVTVSGHWARWCGITACSVVGTPHQHTGNRCAYLTTIHYCYRLLNKVIWDYGMKQWWPLITSALSVHTWQPYVTATGCWTRWHGTTAWSSGGHSSPAYWRRLSSVPTWQPECKNTQPTAWSSSAKVSFLSHSDHQDQQRNCALSWLILIDFLCFLFVLGHVGHMKTKWCQ